MKAYFIGIGGIGVSALARLHLAAGHKVAGSDRATSRITTELEKLGAKIFLEPRAENISADTDLVIYSLAVPLDQPEMVRAREQGVKIQSYPEALGELSRQYFTIAVAGTHGKTTTTAMLAEICLTAGLDPTVIVGSLLSSRKTNFIAGKSKYLIVEACEYRRAFLNLSLQILIITNIDNDHLDYYHDLADIESAFTELSRRLPPNGVLITEKEYGKIKTDFKLKVPGQHNVRNAQAALAAAAALDIPYLTAVTAVENFAGTWRRFEYRGEMKTGAKVYDDYAHHPSEIRATLAGAREVTKGKIWLVFQPHLYSRTKQLFADFVSALAAADQVIVTEIYAAREAVDPEISGAKLAEAVGGKFMSDFKSIADYLQSETHAGDLVISMGAGDISQLVDRLL